MRVGKKQEYGTMEIEVEKAFGLFGNKRPRESKGGGGLVIACGAEKAVVLDTVVIGVVS